MKREIVNIVVAFKPGHDWVNSHKTEAVSKQQILQPLSVHTTPSGIRNEDFNWHGMRDGYTITEKGVWKGLFWTLFSWLGQTKQKKKTRTTECSSCLFIYVFIYFSLKVMEADWIQAFLMILNLLWSEEEEDDTQATLAALHFWLFSEQHVYIWLNHPHVSFPFENATLLLRSGLPSTRKRWSWTASQTQLFFDGLAACDLPWVPEASRGLLS